ncbi:MAG: hypothetical protein HN348_30530 [Proteobacteria bacterium]|nr:hypothetical protein [Pseudomonadota bacterium]
MFSRNNRTEVLDRKQIRRRLLLKLFGSPTTLLPVAGGMTAMLFPVFFQADPAIPLFLGVTGVAVGLAALVLRGLLGRERITEEVLAEHEQETSANQEVMLNALERRLERDRDARTEALLGDLRELVGVLRDDNEWRSKMSSVAASDILDGVDELFGGCVQSLDRTLELHNMAIKINTKSAREGLMVERERIITEVERSVEQLSTFVTKLRTLGTESDGGPNLASIRTGLDTSIAAARATAEEARSWSPLDREPLAEISKASSRPKKEKN